MVSGMSVLRWGTWQRAGDPAGCAGWAAGVMCGVQRPGRMRAAGGPPVQACVVADGGSVCGVEYPGVAGQGHAGGGDVVRGEGVTQAGECLAGGHGCRRRVLADSSASRMPSRRSVVAGAVMMVPGVAVKRGNAQNMRLWVPQMIAHRGLLCSMRAAVSCSCGSAALPMVVTCAVLGCGRPRRTGHGPGGRVVDAWVPSGDWDDSGREQGHPGEQAGYLGAGAWRE